MLTRSVVVVHPSRVARVCSVSEYLGVGQCVPSD